MRQPNKDNNRNAVRHGIMSNRILPTEDPEEYKRLQASFFARFQPADDVEAACVQTMFDSVWRRERILKTETDLLTMAFNRASANPKAHTIALPNDNGLQAAAFEYCASETRALDMIVRYEAMLRRSYDRAYAQLKELQANRPQPSAPSPVAPQLAPSTDPDLPAYIREGRDPLPGETDDPFWNLELQKLQNEKCHAGNAPRGGQPQREYLRKAA